jgi:prepilin signal peptidase PulO-like enzyme (type II secretory pathway)
MFVTELIIAVIGLIAGGIINALADDLPFHRPPKLPHYPDGTPRPLIAWSGITAFLLGQRKSLSGSKLTWRYPLTEITTIVAMLVTYSVKHDVSDVSSLQLIFWLAYMPVFVLITVIDIEHRLILFAVMIPSCLFALLDAILTPTQREPDLQNAFLGAALGFGVFFIMYLGGWLYIYITQKVQNISIPEVAFGYGDVMLATFSGLILGWQPLIFAMFITVFLGAGGALIYLISRRLAGGNYSLFTPLPYGPYIVAGTVIMLLFSSQVRLIIAGY